MSKKGDLLAEISIMSRQLFHRLAQVGEHMHQDAPVTISQRALLEDVYRNGPRTIPELAAGRSVTRQQIQKNVEDLRKLKLVTVIENPAHKRSFYVSLSDRGKKLIAGMIAQESSVFRALATEYGLEDLKTTHRVLGKFMRQLESLL